MGGSSDVRTDRNGYTSFIEEGRVKGAQVPQQSEAGSLPIL